MKISNFQIQKINEQLTMFVEKYSDIPVSSLLAFYGLNPTAKNIFNSLIVKLLNNTNSDILCDIVHDKDFCFKTVRLDKYGNLKEAMSLPVFKFNDIVVEKWENSQLRDYFHKKVFAFTVYRSSGMEFYLSKIVIWKMPDDILDTGVRAVWKEMQDLLLNGNIVKYIDERGRYKTYFPTAGDNPYVHVRPHAQSRNDTYPLPVQDKVTGLIQYPKHSFWLNRTYVLKIITEKERN